MGSAKLRRMFVPCPHCGFLLALIVAKDGAANRCPRCDGELPAADATSPGAAAGSAIDAGAPDRDGATQADASAKASAEAGAGAGNAEAPDPVASLIAGDAATADAPAATRSTPTAVTAPAARRRGRKPGTPSFAHAAHTAVPLGPRWPGLVVIAALLLVLATQLLLAERATLAASAQWRPMAMRACAVLLCELPPWHEPSTISMLDRGVQPHPHRPGVLAVRASFRNDARWPQPWPTLLLTLADVDGGAIAQGAFAPREYGAPADGATLLAPGEVATIGFAVREPQPRSVAFSFEFR